MPHFLNTLKSLALLFVYVWAICHNKAIYLLLTIVNRIRTSLLHMRLTIVFLQLTSEFLRINLCIHEGKRVKWWFVYDPWLINQTHCVITLRTILIKTLNLFLFFFWNLNNRRLLLIFLCNSLSPTDPLPYLIDLIDKCFFFFNTHDRDSSFFRLWIWMILVFLSLLVSNRQ